MHLIADLDIVNPYFRSADSEKELTEAGIKLISSKFANSNVDLPALPAEAYRLVSDFNTFGIIDIGGDDRGAYALGRFVPSIIEENNYRMVFVVNCYRPLTRTVNDTITVMNEIQEACGLKFTDIVNNSNLGNETTAQTVLDSIPYIHELSSVTGLPVFMHTVHTDLASDLSCQIDNVFPLQLQKKYFDIPAPPQNNRPLWG